MLLGIPIRGLRHSGTEPSHAFFYPRFSPRIVNVVSRFEIAARRVVITKLNPTRRTDFVRGTCVDPRREIERVARHRAEMVHKTKRSGPFSDRLQRSDSRQDRRFSLLINIERDVRCGVLLNNTRHDVNATTRTVVIGLRNNSRDSRRLEAVTG